MCKQDADAVENSNYTERLEGDGTLKRERKTKRRKRPLPDSSENMEGIEGDAHSTRGNPVPVETPVDKPPITSEVVTKVDEYNNASESSSFKEAEGAVFQNELPTTSTDRSIKRERQVKSTLSPKKNSRDPKKGNLRKTSVDADAFVNVKPCSQENPLCLGSLSNSGMRTLNKGETPKFSQKAPENEMFMDKEPSTSTVPCVKVKRNRRKQRLECGSLTENGPTTEVPDKTSRSATTKEKVKSVKGGNRLGSSSQSSDIKTLNEGQIHMVPQKAPENEFFLDKEPSLGTVPVVKVNRNRRKQRLEHGSLTENSPTAEVPDKTSQGTTTKEKVESVRRENSVLPAEIDVCDRMEHVMIVDNNYRNSTHDTTCSSLQAEGTDLMITVNKDGDNQANNLACALEAVESSQKEKESKPKEWNFPVNKNFGSSKNYPSRTLVNSLDSNMEHGVLCQPADEIHISKKLLDVSEEDNLEDHGKQDVDLSLVSGHFSSESVSTLFENDKLKMPVHLKVGQPLSSHPSKKLLVLDVNGILVDICGQYDTHHTADKKIGRRLVFKRPFCDEFLEFCFGRFNVGIWSSLMMRNLKPVVEFLVGNMASKLLFCWDGSFCTRTGLYTIQNKHKPLVLKELKKIWDQEWERVQYTPSTTLLVDDSPYKALSNPPHTAIFPRSFLLRDKDDNALGQGGKIRVYLEGLVMEDDVREYVKNNPFGQPAISSVHPDWDFYKQALQTR